MCGPWSGTSACRLTCSSRKSVSGRVGQTSCLPSWGGILCGNDRTNASGQSAGWKPTPRFRTRSKAARPASFDKCEEAGEMKKPKALNPAGSTNRDGANKASSRRVQNLPAASRPPRNPPSALSMASSPRPEPHSVRVLPPPRVLFLAPTHAPLLGYLFVRDIKWLPRLNRHIGQVVAHVTRPRLLQLVILSEPSFFHRRSHSAPTIKSASIHRHYRPVVTITCCGWQRVSDLLPLRAPVCRERLVQCEDIRW